MILTPFKWIVALFFNWSNALSHDPGWAVVGMSVLLSLLLTPLYIWIERRKNSDKAKSAPMQAEIDKIEAVYSGRERFYYTREIQRRYHYSPWTAMIPTLGLLVQIPFLLAAYHYLSELQIFNGASFFYIKDLSKPDTIATVAGFPVNLLAILMTVINLVSGWRYAESGKPKERIQYMAVAAIFLFLLYNCAASVVLYWTLSNALSFARSEIFFRQKGASVAPLAVENVIIIARWVCVCFLLLAVLLAIDAELLRGLTGAGLVCCIKKLYFGVALGIIVPALVVGCVSIWRFKNGVALPYAFNVTFFFFIMSLLTPIVADVAAFPIESVPLIAYFSRMGFAFATVFSVVLLVLSWGTAFPMATSVASRMAYDVNCTLGFLFAISIALQIFVCGPVCSFASCPEVATDVTVGSLLWQGLLRLAMLVGVTYVVLKFMPVGIARIFLVALQIAFVVLFVNGNLIPYDYGVLFQGSYSKAASIVPECWRLVLEAIVFVGLFLTAGKLVRFIDRNYKLVRFMLILIVLSFIVRTGYAIIRTTKVSAQAISEDAQNDEKLFRFSKTGKNVVFLLLDSFVGQRFGPLLDSDMSLKKTFDGFTWYPVTISASWFTFPNVPAMWAGEEYFPWRLGKTRKLGDVFNEAWNTYQQNVHSREYRFATSTRAQGYGCKILDAERTYHEMAYKRGQANETLQKSVNLESLKGNSLLHAVPLALRSIIYDSGHWNMDDRKATAYDATFNFMSDLAKNSEVIEDSRGVYIHIHNESTHFPYYSPVNGVLSICGVDRCFKWSLLQVAYWIEWLKKNNVYDNTRIILCSDHGIGNDNEITFDARYAKNVDLMKKASDCVCSYFALLAVKDFGAHGEIKVDMSTKTVSHGVYFAFDNPRFSHPVKEIVSSYVTNPYPPTWKESDGFDIRRSFRIIGDASDGANWSRLTK